MSDIAELIAEVRKDIQVDREAIRQAVLQEMINTKIKIENLDQQVINLINMGNQTTTTPPKPRASKKGKEGEEAGETAAQLMPEEQNDFQVDAKTAMIIDDLLHNNNVYLYGSAGTGKTYLAQQIADLFKANNYIPSDTEAYRLINCNQWTSPIQLLGGWSIGGYQQGAVTLAWENGGVLILDELPKLDSNTAGLLNEVLAKTAQEDATIIDGQNRKIKKHPQFYVIGTGNTDMKSTALNYGGNQKQDYSLVDRFAGSYYKIDFDVVKEMTLNYFAVFAISYGIRKHLVKAKAEESISLRTMLNMGRAYEIEMLRKEHGNSPILDELNEFLGNNSGKTLAVAVYSFLETLPHTMKENFKTKTLETVGEYNGKTIDEALIFASDSISSGDFNNDFIRLTGQNPATGEYLSKDQIKALKEKYKEKAIKASENLPSA